LVAAQSHPVPFLGCRPLHWAAVSGHVDTVRTLFELGGDVDAKNENGQTPLQVPLLPQPAAAIIRTLAE
jgi:ankyrin repeat protein